MCVVGEKVSEKVGTFLYHAKLELTRPFPQRSTGAPQGQERWGAAVCGSGGSLRGGKRVLWFATCHVTYVKSLRSSGGLFRCCAPT